MTWNIRLVDMTTDNHEGEKYYEIREVFYDQLGKPIGHTTATVSGEDLSEIRQYCEWIIESLDRPILRFKDGK